MSELSILDLLRLTRKIVITFVAVTLFFCVRGLAQDTKSETDNPLQIGKPDAEFRIEVFNDYQCPACAAFNEKLKNIEEKYSDRIQITFRNFILLDRHRNALDAAKAVEAAAKQSKFREMMNLIYKNQSKWSNSENPERIFTKYAQKLDLDTELFKQDFQSQMLLDKINSDLERSKSLKINSIPTIFVNGKQISFADAEDLEKIISKEIK